MGGVSVFVRETTYIDFVVVCVLVYTHLHACLAFNLKTATKSKKGKRVNGFDFQTKDWLLGQTLLK